MDPDEQYAKSVRYGPSAVWVVPLPQGKWALFSHPKDNLLQVISAGTLEAELNTRREKQVEVSRQRVTLTPPPVPKEKEIPTKGLFAKAQTMTPTLPGRVTLRPLKE